MFNVFKKRKQNWHINKNNITYKTTIKKLKNNGRNIY